MDKNLVEKENEISHEDFKTPNQAEKGFINYIARFETFHEILERGEPCRYTLNKFREEIRLALPENIHGSEYIDKIGDIMEAICQPSNTELHLKAKKHFEEYKTLVEKCALIDREKRRQKLQVSIINQTEDCLKIFKRYLDFLNDKDYIKLEKIKSSTEQFIKIYEKLFDLDSETPKRLGSLFRSVKIAFNLILFLENNLAYHLIDFNKKELEGNIEIVEAEILRWKEYFRGRGVL